MGQYHQSHSWNSRSPLMSLVGLALIICSSNRLSSAALIALLLIGIYTITLSIILLGKSIIPERYQTALIIMIVTFISSLFYLVVEMIHPVSALELYFIIFLIPVTFLSSEIVQRANRLAPADGIVLGMKESLILGGIIIAISIIREPIAYGTLSIPFSGKTVTLLPEMIQERMTLHILASPLGGFILLAGLIALVRAVSYRQGSTSEED
ncbi:MAG: hypothetical protein LBV20_01340 [Treponema sp.]|jgi:Na+-translocating ferredoxin:NAD+ oxidoreductase RnfE subunit|nr:hypothetical protein [Treponema sp.]